MSDASDAFPDLTKRLAAAWRGAARFVADLVYPPHCPGCGAASLSHRALCPACWASVRFIERPYCEVLGMPFRRDEGAGALSPAAIAHPPPFDRLRAVALHEGRARDLVHALKYRDRTDLAPMMAAWMVRASEGHAAACDAVVPVPLHARRLLFRRFNQSAELGRAVAKVAGKPFLARTLLRVKPTRRQVGLSARRRAANVRGAFRVRESRIGDVKGKRLLLIDDVYTTGATVSAAAKALKRAGAAQVTVLTFAMALGGPI